MPEPCSPRRNTKGSDGRPEEASQTVFGLEIDLIGEGPWLQTEDLVQLDDLKPSLPPHVLHDLRSYMEDWKAKHEDNSKDTTTLDHLATYPRKHALAGCGQAHSEQCHEDRSADCLLDELLFPADGVTSPTPSVDSTVAELSSSDCSSDTWSDMEVPASSRFCIQDDAPAATKCWNTERNVTKATHSPAMADPLPPPTVCFLKRPKNGFIRYAMKNRRQVSTENPQLDNREISRILGLQWRHLSPARKAEFELEFQAEMDSRKQLFPDWNYGARRNMAYASLWDPIPTRLRPRDKLKRKFLPSDIPRLSRPYVRRRSRPTEPVTPACDNWVQCDRCNKWRRLARHQSPGYLPDTWFCEYNHFPFNSCSVPEESAEHDVDLAFHDHSYPSPLPPSCMSGETGQTEPPVWDLDELLGFPYSWGSPSASAVKAESMVLRKQWDDLDAGGSLGQWDNISLNRDITCRPRAELQGDDQMSREPLGEQVGMFEFIKFKEHAIKCEVEPRVRGKLESSVEEQEIPWSDLSVFTSKPYVVGNPGPLKEECPAEPWSGGCEQPAINPTRHQLSMEDSSDAAPYVLYNSSSNSLSSHQESPTPPIHSPVTSAQHLSVPVDFNNEASFDFLIRA